jgi:hypothetical protein
VTRYDIHFNRGRRRNDAACLGARSRTGPHRERAHRFPLDPITTKWTGDFDGMRERRMIRVLTVYSKTP